MKKHLLLSIIWVWISQYALADQLPHGYLNGIIDTCGSPVKIEFTKKTINDGYYMMNSDGIQYDMSTNKNSYQLVIFEDSGKIDFSITEKDWIRYNTVTTAKVNLDSLSVEKTNRREHADRIKSSINFAGYLFLVLLCLIVIAIGSLVFIFIL